jgi:hypothetical protein
LSHKIVSRNENSEWTQQQALASIPPLFAQLLFWTHQRNTVMRKKATSADLLKEFGKGRRPGETDAQRKEKAFGVLAAMMSEGRITNQKIITAPGFRLSRAATLVLTTVNAPYGTHYNAKDLTDLIRQPNATAEPDPAVFAFFSEVDIKLQIAFLQEQSIDLDHASAIARSLSALAGYDLPLACARTDFLDADAPTTV